MSIWPNKESLVIKIDEENEENSIEEFTPHTPWLEKAKSGIKPSKLQDHKQTVWSSMLRSSPLSQSKSVTFKEFFKDQTISISKEERDKE